MRQMTNWSCGIAALASALCHVGARVSERQLASIFRRLGLPPRSWGVTAPAIGVVSAYLGYTNRIFVPYWFFRNNWIQVRNRQPSSALFEKALRRLSKKSDLRPFYRSLIAAIKLGCSVKLPNDKRFPGVRHICEELRRGHPVVVLIRGSDFYGVEENWYHYLALLPKGTHVEIHDPYRERGFGDYENWKSYLDTARAYNWNTWNGAFIAID